MPELKCSELSEGTVVRTYTRIDQPQLKKSFALKLWPFFQLYGHCGGLKQNKRLYIQRSKEKRIGKERSTPPPPNMVNGQILSKDKYFHMYILQCIYILRNSLTQFEVHPFRVREVMGLNPSQFRVLTRDFNMQLYMLLLCHYKYEQRNDLAPKQLHLIRGNFQK